MKREEWIWMPHPAHLIVAHRCRFHLATYVGKFVVSTVGEYFPEEGSREINSVLKGIKLEGKGDEREYDYMKKFGFEDIGAGRKYETMVFPAKENTECKACPWCPAEWSGVDAAGYNDPGKAYLGHLAMCEKYANYPHSRSSD